MVIGLFCILYVQFKNFFFRQFSLNEIRYSGFVVLIFFYQMYMTCIIFHRDCLFIEFILNAYENGCKTDKKQRVMFNNSLNEIKDNNLKFNRFRSETENTI